MLNWNTNEKKFKKLNSTTYGYWRLTQLINYGLDNEKLNKKEVVNAWPHIKDNLDIDMRKALEFLIWGTKWVKEPGLHPDRSNFLTWFIKTKNSKLAST